MSILYASMGVVLEVASKAGSFAHFIAIFFKEMQMRVENLNINRNSQLHGL